MNIKNMIDNLKTEKYEGIPIKKTIITKRKESISDFFTETFKVLDLLDREREKRKYTLDYKDQIEIYERYQKKSNNEDDDIYIENQLKELKKKIRYEGYVTNIRIPEDKIEIMLNNYFIEDRIAKQKESEVRKNMEEIENEINDLIRMKSLVEDELNEIVLCRDSARSILSIMNQAKENDGLLRLTTSRGGTQAITGYELLRNSYKPYRYYNEKKKVKVNE